MPMASRTKFIAGSAAAALAVSFPPPSRADVRPLHVAYFPGVSALPLLIAIRADFFNREQLDVRAAPATSSIDLFAQLDSGTLDLAHTSIDNPIAYDTGAGTVAVAHRDFCAFLGVDDGQLRLVVRPGITTLASSRRPSTSSPTPPASPRWRGRPTCSDRMDPAKCRGRPRRRAHGAAPARALRTARRRR
jgi:hypothetical protein